MQVIPEQGLSRAAAVRRAQIVEATVLALAELGYQGASFVEIAKRARLSSTRLISYHFEGRAELMALVASQVIGRLGGAVEAALRSADSPIAAVRAYIAANLTYMDAHRAEMAALTSLLLAGVLTVPAGQGSAGVEALTNIIDAGRRAGQLRDVDSTIAATVIQRTVEAVPLLLRDRPDVDLTHHARELIGFFEAALLRTDSVAAPA